MVELKPCPFCGGKAKLYGGGLSQENFSIWCTGHHHISCKAGILDVEAIEAWNTRAPIPETTPVSDIRESLSRKFTRGTHYTIKHDGFAGLVIGDYRTIEGKNGVVLQLDGAQVVHVYGEKWLVPDTPTQHKPDCNLSGPYGWLVVDPALSEAEWFIQDGRLSEFQKRDGVIAFPVHLTEQDQERLLVATSKPDDVSGVTKVSRREMQQMPNSEPPPKAEIEPVAWRYRANQNLRIKTRGDLEWQATTIKENVAAPERYVFEVEPLYSQAQIDALQKQVAAAKLVVFNDGAVINSYVDQVVKLKADIDLLGRCFGDVCDELGCEHDNEAALMAVHDLKAQLATVRAETFGQLWTLCDAIARDSGDAGARGHKTNDERAYNKAGEEMLSHLRALVGEEA